MVMSYSAIGYGVLGYYINRNRFSVKTGMLLAVIGYAAVLLPTLLVTRANGVLFQGCLDGMTFGMVTCHSVCQRPAPSIFAASSMSSGMACRPAM